MTLRAYRAPCSELNRSLIWLEFILAEQYATEALEIQLPTVVAETAPHWRRLMSLTTEPNGWGSEGWVDRESVHLITHVQGLKWYFTTPGGDRRWVFLVDNGPVDPYQYPGSGLTPAEYNAAFELILRYNPYDFLTIDVPATLEVLPAATPQLPLSGRLSGNWVTPAAADQGVLLAVSEKVLPDIPGVANGAEMPMVLFFAHYTYDAEGNMLWLTGSAEFEPNANQVTIPVELVTHGEFRGSKEADREIIGSVTLTSHSCNDLALEYDYSGVGLGTGLAQLVRLFSLETAGHDCRDYEAKVATVE